MHIQWLGNSCIRIQTKYQADPVDIIIDPYKPEEGSFPRNLTSDIALYSRGSEGSITVSGNPFVIETPGEFETKNVFIYGVAAGATTIYYFETEQITCAHLGHLKKELTERELDLVSGADVVFVPVGGGDVADAERAVSIITQIEPRIVVPICFNSAKGEKWADVKGFLKAMGVTAETPEPKLKLAKKDLPTDETKVVVLERSAS